MPDIVKGTRRKLPASGAGAYVDYGGSRSGSGAAQNVGSGSGGSSGGASGGTEMSDEDAAWEELYGGRFNYKKKVLLQVNCCSGLTAVGHKGT